MKIVGLCGADGDNMKTAVLNSFKKMCAVHDSGNRQIATRDSGEKIYVALGNRRMVIAHRSLAYRGISPEIRRIGGERSS